ncbi:ATP-binding protein [Maribacter arcticus]|uniref:sensor histidine kinase n=1 Tax=Maribacter arcticus TaxID=561365 RepID=UPI0030016507
MSEPKKHPIFNKPFLIGFLVFLLVLIISQTITYQRFQILQEAQQHEVNERVRKLKEDLQDIFGQSFDATQTLSFIIENYGIPNNFDSIAQLLLNSNKHIDALELVDDQGVITHVYPLIGNEVLGFNILKDSIGKEGALTTLKRRDYFTAGPISLKQGGTGFVSRRPLFNENGFAGFVATLVKLSTVVTAAQIDSLKNPNFSYQLAKINADQSEEIFYNNTKTSTEEAIKVPITTSHGEMKLYVISNQPQSYSTILFFFILGLLLALVCGAFTMFLLRQPIKLNQLVQEKIGLLKESQEKFTKAFQTNLMGMIMLDSERKVIEANDVVYKLLEVTREGLIGKTIMESAIAVMENYDDNEREKFWKHFLKHDKVINQKFKITLKSGQKLSLSVSIESLFFNDKQHYLVNLIDETKRKEAEEALELQNIQLKKTNSELDSFVYSASHELRAPLASVLGLINLILTEENKPGLVASLTMMEKSVRRLDDFIKDIIEYSRNKHLKVNVETINFTNLIESSIESFWYLENMNKIKVKINVDDKIDFASDKKRISILLNNFISNAIKYHDVSKRTPTIWISIKTSKKEAIIAIKDNGLGMAEEQLDKIFDMFYRISYQIMGSGIGLFIVKEVLGKLNGTIEVKSALGEGSTFTLKIPNGSDK